MGRSATSVVHEAHRCEEGEVYREASVTEETCLGFPVPYTPMPRAVSMFLETDFGSRFPIVPVWIDPGRYIYMIISFGSLKSISCVDSSQLELIVYDVSMYTDLLKGIPHAISRYLLRGEAQSVSPWWTALSATHKNNSYEFLLSIHPKNTSK